MPLLLFEDEHVARLSPVTLARPAFAVSCGGERLIDLLAELDPQPTCLVRPHLRAFAKSEVGDRKSELTLAVNARVVPSGEKLQILKSLLAAGKPGVIRSGDRVAAAFLRAADLPATDDASAFAASLEKLNLPVLAADLALIDYPHDLLRHHAATLKSNLERRIARGGYKQLRDGVFAAAGVTLTDLVATDTRQGPILIDEGATIGPFSFLRGPLLIGQNARVNEHAALKDGTVLGHTTKAGGEIEASIIEPFSNKQHHGYLGNSYLGSWVNLGAGTANSDLKNTYGSVAMDVAGQKIDTQLQFLGCFVGDYTKTAINTAIFTGKTIGACSMVYGYATTNVPSFVNYARTFGQTSEVPVDVAIETQRRMFARRNVPHEPRCAQLIRDLFDLTRPDREALGPLPTTPPRL